MRISIFGLGYVGVVTAACLAEDGHDVVGVDVADAKVATINAGRSPVVEHGMDALVGRVVSGGKLRATRDARQAVLATDLSLICVGTPSRANGAVDLAAVEAVAEEIGGALGEKPAGHVVIVRSTLPPGTTRRTVIPILEQASGRRCGEHFAVCYNPEFLREGSSIEDFRSPALTILGEAAPGAGERAVELYASVAAPLRRCALEVAESAKYANNAFHALKVGFANELGVALKAFGVDSHAVLDLVCEDRRLNISPAYLRPGFAFGGSCLPKDLRVLLAAARERGVELPVIGQLLPSNHAHIERAVALVLSTGERDVTLLGLSFKSGTDDLRESPLVLLAERLIGRGCRLRIFDPEVRIALVTGANRAFMERELPHLEALLTNDLGHALATARVLVVGSDKGCDPEVLGKWAETGTIVDLYRVPDALRQRARAYHGICW